jgi:hypothetical protein
MLESTSPVVRCAHTAIVNPRDLLPHPANPNRHPPKQIELFIEILKFQGARRAITVSKRSGFITKGHGQLEAYLHAGWTEVPVDYQDYENDQSELADIVADNQLQRMSEMDTGRLQEIGTQLDTGAFNMNLLGIEESKLEMLMTSARPTPPPILQGADGAPLVAGPVAPAGAEGPIQTTTQPSASHVRMVQLFFTEESQAEFMHIIEFFQKELQIDNVTDTNLEVLRAAYRSHNEQPEGPVTEAATVGMATPENGVGQLQG